MHLSKINEALNHRITGGSEYQWNCYGYNVRFLDFESEHAHASVLFDTVTQEVYEATVTSKDESVRPYRWLNPDTKQSYLDEAKEKNINPNMAWDDVYWCDLEVEEDFLEKANAIFQNLSFDQRVSVPLDLDDSTILQLALEAHKRDITLNQMVEIVLQKAIDFHKDVNAK